MVAQHLCKYSMRKKLMPITTNQVIGTYRTVMYCMLFLIGVCIDLDFRTRFSSFSLYILLKSILAIIWPIVE